MALLLECMHGRPRPQARSGICLFLISYFSILPNSYPYNLRRQALELEPTAGAEEEERSSSLAADLNREAHDAALGLVADSARQRYESRGRRLRFPPDRRAPGGTRRREPRGHPAAASHARSRLPALCAGGSALRARLAAPGRQPVLSARPVPGLAAGERAAAYLPCKGSATVCMQCRCQGVQPHTHKNSCNTYAWGPPFCSACAVAEDRRQLSHAADAAEPSAAPRAAGM